MPEQDPDPVATYMPQSGNNDNLRILYITLGLIILIGLVWIIIVWWTGEDALNVLRDMMDAGLQLPTASDNIAIPSAPQPENIASTI